MSETLQAGVQYGDFEGTAAADNADTLAIVAFLRNKGALSEGDFLVGLRFWVGENLGDEVETPAVRVLYTQANGFDDFKGQTEGNQKLNLKELELELTFEEFFKLFKRFEVVLVNSNLNLIGREYDSQK